MARSVIGTIIAWFKGEVTAHDYAVVNLNELIMDTHHSLNAIFGRVMCGNPYQHLKTITIQMIYQYDMVLKHDNSE